MRMWGGVMSDEVSVVLPLSRWGLRGFYDKPEWSRNSPLLPFLFSFDNRSLTPCRIRGSIHFHTFPFRCSCCVSDHFFRLTKTAPDPPLGAHASCVLPRKL